MYAQWLCKGRTTGSIHILATHPVQDFYGRTLYDELKAIGGVECNLCSTLPWFLDTECDPQISRLAWSRMVETIYNPPSTKEIPDPDVYITQSSLPSSEVPMYKSYIGGHGCARLNLLKESLMSLGFHSQQEMSSRSQVLRRLYGGVILLQNVLIGYYKDYITHVSTELYKSGCCYHSIPEINGTE